MQYQAILFMKNSLSRLLNKHRRRSRIAPSNPTFTKATGTGQKSVAFSGDLGDSPTGLDETVRSQIKAALLELIQNPDNIILTKNAYEQLTLVATTFIKFDFPKEWTSMNTWLLKSLDSLFESMQQLSIEDAPKVLRFLGFYHEVMKEQSKKQLTTSKGHFYRVAKDHFRGVVRIWTFFNQQQM